MGRSHPLVLWGASPLELDGLASEPTRAISVIAQTFKPQFAERHDRVLSKEPLGKGTLRP